MSKYLSSQVAMTELGMKLKEYRVSSSLTQEQLALKSGISRRSIQHLENGKDVKFTTIIKVLMSLDLDSNLDLLVPDSTLRPSYYLKMNKSSKRPSRVYKKKRDNTKPKVRWGDEK